MHVFRFLLPKLFIAVLIATGATGCSKEARVARLIERADQYFKNGEYEKAKIEYLRALKKDPQNPAAIKQLGVIWYEQGVPMRAFPFLIRTRELASTNLENRLKLAVCFQAVGQFGDARQESLAILEQSATNDEAIVLMAETSFTQEDIEGAEQQLNKINAPDRASVHLAAANLALRKADIGAAEAALRRALTLDPKSAPAHLAMGNIYLIRTNATSAAQEFKTAAELAPIRSTTRLNYADFLAKSGSKEEAKTYVKELLAKAPDYVPAWKILAQIALTEKKYDESLSILENIFTRDPSNFDGRMLQTQNWLLKGDAKNSLEGMERLNTLYPSVPSMKHQLARAYLLNTNTIQAVAALNQAISLNPEYTDARLLLAEINLRTGEHQETVTEMQVLLKKYPDLIPAKFLLAEGYRAMGRLDDASSVYLALIKAMPNYAQPYLRLGIIQKQQNRPSEARKSFEKVLELEPANPLAFPQVIELDLIEKNYAQALQRIQAKQKVTPEDASSHYLEARVYVAQKDWLNAEKSLQKTLELNPNYTAAYDLLISTYIATQRLDQAQKQVTELLVKNPNDLKNLIMSGLIYEKTEDYPKARDAYEKLLSSRPDYTPALNNLAYLYLEHLNQLDKAYDLAKRARTLQPSDAALADTLGWILYKRGEYQQAVALLAESAAKIPNSPEIQFHLGMAHYMMGQTEAARVAFKQAASSTSDFPGKQEAQRRLALLGDTSGGGKELAAVDLEELLKQQPEDIVARVRLGDAYHKQGAFPKAAAAYEYAIKQNPKLLGPLTKLAELNAGPLQNKEKAFEYAKKARELAPNDPQTAGILGGVAYQTGNYSWSYSLLKDSSRQAPSDATILNRLAWAAYSLGKVAEAREAMNQMKNANPSLQLSSDAKAFLAMTAGEENPKNLAPESEVDSLLKSNTAFVPAQIAKAAHLIQRGDKLAAITIYNDVLRQFPDFAPAQKNLASIYLEDPANRGKAYDLAIKARKTLVDDIALAKTLAHIRYQRKEFPSAIQLFQEYARKAPLDAKSLFCLGMSYAQTKDKVRGKQSLEQSLAAGLQDPEATEAKQTLSELQ